MHITYQDFDLLTDSAMGWKGNGWEYRQIVLQIEFLSNGQYVIGLNHLLVLFWQGHSYKTMIILTSNLMIKVWNHIFCLPITMHTNWRCQHDC